MSTNVSTVVNHFPSAQNGFSTTLSSSINSGAATVPVNALTGYSNGEIAAFVVDPTDAIKKQTFTGVVDVDNLQITGVKWTAGTNQNHLSGAAVVDYASATHISMMSKGILVQHNQDGTHNDISVDHISEKTAAHGVIIDDLAIKDGKLVTANSVVTANVTDKAITQAKMADKFYSQTSIASLGPTVPINVLTGQSAALEIAIPTFTPYEGQGMVIRLKDNGTPRAITFTSAYQAMGLTAPTTTVANKWMYLGFMYNSTATKWDLISVIKEA